MKSALHTYSRLLQLRGDTIAALLQSRQGIAYALKLFVVVTLIAGLGRWVGLPALLRELTLAEQIEQAAVTVRQTGADVVAAVLPALSNLQTLPGALAGVIQERVAPVAEQASQLAGELSPQVATAQQLLQQSRITADEIERAVAQSQLTPEQLSLLLARADVSPAQLDQILQRAGVTATQLDEARQRAAAATSAANAELQPLLDRLAMSADQLQQLLALISATPEQLNRILDLLSISADQLGLSIQQVEATPAQLEQFTLQVRDEVTRMEPPIGVRPSRVVRLGGQWLSTPFLFAADWFFFALVLLVVAKSLGGRATLPQHIAAVALAAAPAILLIGNYVPAPAPLASPALLALHAFGRVLALAGVIWCGALLLKSLATAHQFGLWKTAGSVALTWIVMYVVTPLAAFLATQYLLR